MATRTTSSTVTFKRPFRLGRDDAQLPAGNYAIEMDAEPIDGLSSLVYQRVEVRVFVPRISGVCEAQMLIVSAREFDAAVAADGEVINGSEPNASQGAHAERTTFETRKEVQLNPRNTLRDKGANTPLYGALLATLALLATGIALGRMDTTARESAANTTVVQDVR